MLSGLLQAAELPNLKWQVNVLVSALEKLGCSSSSSNALLNPGTSHVGHPAHMHEDARGMEAAMPMSHPLGSLQDVSLHNPGMLPQHLGGELPSAELCTAPVIAAAIELTAALVRLWTTASGRCGLSHIALNEHQAAYPFT